MALNTEEVEAEVSSDEAVVGDASTTGREAVKDRDLRRLLGDESMDTTFQLPTRSSLAHLPSSISLISLTPSASSATSFRLSRLISRLMSRLVSWLGASLKLKLPTSSSTGGESDRRASASPEPVRLCFLREERREEDRSLAGISMGDDSEGDTDEANADEECKRGEATCARTAGPGEEAGDPEEEEEGKGEAVMGVVVASDERTGELEGSVETGGS